jgi:hypothetical protein
VNPSSTEFFARWLIPVSGAVVIVTCVSGFLIDARGFLGNILAGIAGIFASIIIALLFVENYSKYLRQGQWARVRNLTYQAIAAHLCDLTTDIFMYFPVRDHRHMTTIIDGRNHPNPATFDAMASLISQLRSLSSSETPEKSTSDISVEFYEEVKWDFDQIRDVLTPRVVQSSDDQQLIDALMRLDQTRRNLHNAIIMHKRAVTHSVFPHIIAVIEQVRLTYGLLYEQWEQALRK